MLNEQQVQLLKAMLQRVFALPVKKSSIRQIQNGLFQICEGDKDLINKTLSALMLGKMEKGVADGKAEEAFKGILSNFSVLVRMAKEISDKGDFINIITSDALKQKEDILFMNTIRKVDGEEFHYITDINSTLHFIGHLCNRLLEATEQANQKKAIENYEKELKTLSKAISGR